MALRPSLQFVVVPPKVRHTATVIFLHALGDSGAGWLPIVQMMQQDPGLGHIKWVLPHAPQMEVTMCSGMELPAWYDIVSRESIEPYRDDEDKDGIFATAHSINRLIASEIDVSPDTTASRIVLGGFSQGGAVALFTGLTTEWKLAGLFGLSSYLPVRPTLKWMMSEHAKKSPIFLGHGTADQLVQFEYGKKCADLLTNQYGFSEVESGQIAGPGVTFKKYEGLITSQELEDLGAWLMVVLPQKQ